jgi:hypothetical protein
MSYTERSNYDRRNLTKGTLAVVYKCVDVCKMQLFP